MQPRPQGLLAFQYAAAILKSEKTLGTRLPNLHLAGKINASFLTLSVFLDDRQSKRVLRGFSF